MKLLYKGSECGVPCTCPSAEEEYVWWTLFEGPVTVGSGTSAGRSVTTPVAVTPFFFRYTCDHVITSIEFRCNTAPVKKVLYTASGTTLNGQQFATFPKEDDTFYIVVTAGSLVNATFSDWAIAVSKEDYAKLVEASGS